MEKQYYSHKSNNFDFLRHFFALLVVLFHIAVLSQHPSLLASLGKINGRLPVCGFFIISGFLISQSYARSESLLLYFKKRARRLLPGYVFVVLFFAAGLMFLSSLSFFTYFTSPLFSKYLVSNLTFLNFLQPCLPGVFDQNVICAVNGALWSIKVEVCFYLLVPLLVHFLNKTQKKIHVVAMLYVLVLVQNYLLMHFLKPGHPALYASLMNQLPAFMTYFLSGMLLHYYFRFFHQNNLLLVLAVLVFALECFMGSEVLLPLAFGVIIFRFAYSRFFQGLNNFSKHGDFSYGMYIFHFPVIQVLIDLDFFAPGKNVCWAVFLALLITFLLAFLSWNVIEKRFLAPGKTSVSNS